MTWKDIVKREAQRVDSHYDKLNQKETMTVNEAHKEVHNIMVKLYGKDYEKKNWAGAEQLQLYNLIYNQGMSPDMAAKQPFTEPEDEEDTRKDWD